MEVILMFLFKLLCGFVITYFIAAFLVSLKRLLPFISIITACVIMGFYYYMENTGDRSVFYIIIILCILTQVMFQGEGFMEPSIQENVYRLVSIERKWESLFEEYDRYELHFEPKEIGGFVENTIIYCIFFVIYYGISNSGNAFGYAYPLYVILMSLVDILYIYVVQFHSLIHWAFHSIILVSSICIGFVGIPFLTDNNSNEPKDVYKYVEKLSKTDYTLSYQFEFETYTKSSTAVYEYEEGSRQIFIYDSQLKAGGMTSEINNDGNNPFDYVVVKDSRFNNLLVRYVNSSTDDYSYTFAGFANEVSGPLKYDTFEHVFDSYILFDRVRYDASSIYRNSNGSSKNILISYEKTFTSGDSYVCQYSFTTDQNYKPTKLNYIQLKTYVDNKKYQMTYTPITGTTKLSDSFDHNGYIKGYVYNKDDNPNHGETYGIEISEILTSLNNFDIVENYDFTLKVNSENELYYVYDAETLTSVEYLNNSNKAQSAINTNNFTSYRPNRVYFNYEEFGFDLDNNDYVDIPFFSKYTGGDEYIYDLIIRMFVDTTLLEENCVQSGNNYVFTCLVENNNIAFEPIQYIFYFTLNNNDFTLNKINIESNDGNIQINFTMYFDDVFYIDGYSYMYM